MWRALVGAHEQQVAWAREARQAQVLAQEADCRRVVAELALSTEDEEYEVIRLRALVEGVTASICARTVDPEMGAMVVRRHLDEPLVGRQPHGPVPGSIADAAGAA